MPIDKELDFVGVDEIQMCADHERGHIFTDRLLNMRGSKLTMFMGSNTIKGVVSKLNDSSLDSLTVISSNKEGALKKFIEQQKANYDYIIIDGAPEVTRVMSTSIATSDLVLVPLAPSGLDFWASESTADMVLQRQDISHTKGYFVFNRYPTRKTLLGGDLQDVVDNHEMPAMKTKIYDRVAYPDSLTQGSSALEWHDKKAKDEMVSLVKEIKEALA